MFIQIKAIRKGMKPPVWRRAYVPLGITFAQMAYILEVLLELPVTDQYEFEFFQEKDRLVEGESTEIKGENNKFRYHNAVQASVDDWSKHKTWFTFRVSGGDEAFPQYRVEIENKADVIIKDEEKVPLPYPILAREISYKGDRYWTEPRALNQKLRDTCELIEGEAEYPSFVSVYKRVERGEGICFCSNLRSQDDAAKDSPRDAAKDSPRDAAKDSPRDAAKDSLRDAAKDSPRDAAKDSVRDAAKDSPRDAAKDSPRDAAKDSLRDAAKDSPRVAGQESSQDVIKGLESEIEQLKKKIEQLKKELDNGEASSKTAARGSLSQASSKTTDNDSPVQMGSASKRSVEEDFFNAKPKKLKSVEEILKVYSKNELKSFAESYGLQLHSATKGKMAFELAGFIMEPKFMKAELLVFEEQELDAFETAIQKGSFYPDEDERYNLDGFLHLKYIAKFKNGMFQVPEDAAIVYTNLCAHGYREFHRKVDWLLDCMETFGHLYAVGKVDLLYKLFCQSKKMKTDRKEFDGLLSQVPAELSACRKIGNRIVVEEAVEKDIYKKLESMLRDVPYYIPTEREISDYAELGYPVSDPAYIKLYDFFKDEMKQESFDCDEYCMRAFLTFSVGDMLSDYMDFLNERDVVFESDKQIKKFVDLITDVSNSTRRFEFRGHTPIEMRAYSSSFGKRGGAFGPKAASGRKPTIIPMNSHVAELLEEGRDQINAMGFDVDTESTSTTIPMIGLKNGMPGNVQTGARKIYPNDPCPCGSGKKYKKCCGRNR